MKHDPLQRRSRQECQGLARFPCSLLIAIMGRKYVTGLPRRHVQDAVAKGAKLLHGGKSDGAFYQPTILGGVTPDMIVFAEESFGPAVCSMSMTPRSGCLQPV